MREYIATGKCKGKDLPEAVVNAAMAAEHDAEVPPTVVLDGDKCDLMYCNRCGACVAIAGMTLQEEVAWRALADTGVIPCCDNPDYHWVFWGAQPTFHIPEPTVTAGAAIELLDNPYHSVNSLLYRRCAKAWDEGAVAVVEQVMESLSSLYQELERTMEALNCLRKDGE